MKYDVFISYSRKDYVDDKENVLPDSPVKAIMEFLDENKISYWIDKKGIYSSSQFVKLITRAIHDSKMLLFVSSKHSNASDYTAGEIIEARNKDKAIIPMRIDETPFSEDYRILINKFDHIEFSKVDAFPKLLSAITKEKKRIAELEAEEQRKREEEERKRLEEIKKLEAAERVRREKEEREAHRKAVLAKIQEQIVQVENHHIAQRNLKNNIYEELRSIEVTEKECPVCHTKCNLDVEYCTVCGWHFYKFSCIPQLNVEISAEEKIALANFSALWGNISSIQDIDSLISKNSSLEAELTRLKEYKTDLTNEFNCLSKERDDLRKELEKLKSEKTYPKKPSKNLKVLDVILKCFGVLGVFITLIFIKECLSDHNYDYYDIPDSTAVDSVVSVADTTIVDTAYAYPDNYFEENLDDV
jgi:FtsZ-binding cell division protein ZapB